MARIVIFCDGTWNSPTQSRPTHVHRLYAACARTAEQEPVYIQGVGTGARWSTMVGRTLDKVGGGAFGWGLNANIISAYRAVAERYQVGDSIHIYGFSRGAYTARSLAGMIRKVGIVENLTPARLRDAFALYRLSGEENAPDKPHILEERRRFSPRFATSKADLAWRGETPDFDGGAAESHLVQVDFLGVWDTVGSLGVPSTLLGPIATLWNRKYRFHDMKLSRMVQSARHAVALDERRVFYRPALWDNLEKSRDDRGLNRGDRSATRPYQQVWFIGTHAIVGGSGRARALSALSLNWVVEGAQEAGLDLRIAPEELDVAADPLVDSEALLDAPLLYRLAGALLEWRKGPGHPVDVHPSVESRLAARPDYRPRSMRGVRPELFGGAPIGPA